MECNSYVLKIDGNRYIYLDGGTYRSSSTRYYGERTAVSLNSTIAAQSTSDYDAYYFVTDLQGSVTSISGSYGSQNTSYTYDAFGTLVQGDLTGSTDYGYLGKQLDASTSLYNYGYRDYKPQTARFTTVDPIRDGNNWFSYVNNDPVNFVDLIGFKIWNFSFYSSMSKYDVAINNTASKIKDYGCALTGLANVITEFLHIKYHEYHVDTIQPTDLNISKNFSGTSDCVDWNEAVSDYGLTAKRSKDKSDAK